VDGVMLLLFVIECPAFWSLKILLATSFLWFVDYLAMRPKFLEEILTFFHVVSAVAG
jgi:hypothetical protein